MVRYVESPRMTAWMTAYTAASQTVENSETYFDYEDDHPQV